MNENINLLYNNVYNKNINIDYEIEKIGLGKIGITDIKFPITDSKEYQLLKKEILSEKFQLDHINTDTLQVYMKRYGVGFPSLVIMSFYKNKKDIMNMNSYINNDSLFSYLLSTLVLDGTTIHILLPIINMDVNFSDIESKIIDAEQFIPLVQSKSESGIACIQIRENYFSLLLLYNYIEEQGNNFDYKILLFQIIHTLAVIKDRFPHFNHNNLILDNIYVYIKKDTNIYTTYKYNNYEFNIPDKFVIKIASFNKASITHFYNNANDNDNDNNNANNNDLLTFVKDLVLKVKTIDKETLDFIKKINSDDYTSILKDKYFNLFHKKISADKMNNQARFITFIESDNVEMLGNQKKYKKIIYK